MNKPTKTIKNLYTFTMDSETGSAKISEVLDSEFDDIYAVSRLFHEFLLSLGHDNDVIERVLKLENL
jgi:hypothetical protein